MKLFMFLAGILLTVTLSQSANAGSNCGEGASGWWLKLDTYPHTGYQSGYISTSSGQYSGCGTCDECRKKLNQDIDGILRGDSQNCVSRGGEVKAANRGQWQEDIRPSQWVISVSGVQIDCQKWVSCN